MTPNRQMLDIFEVRKADEVLYCRFVWCKYSVHFGEIRHVVEGIDYILTYRNIMHMCPLTKLGSFV
ncbi:hypothetical protein BDR05DRAFT_958439, partial [Suillus weaverae]